MPLNLEQGLDRVESPSWRGHRGEPTSAQYPTDGGQGEEETKSGAGSHLPQDISLPLLRPLPPFLFPRTCSPHALSSGLAPPCGLQLTLTRALPSGAGAGKAPLDPSVPRAPSRPPSAFHLHWTARPERGKVGAELFARRDSLLEIPESGRKASHPAAPRRGRTALGPGPVAPGPKPCAPHP